MSEKKHTPGPWVSENEYDRYEYGCGVIANNLDGGVITNPSRGIVAFAVELLPGNSERCIANAHLISAAPDLLEAGEKQTDVLKTCQSLIVSYLVPDGITKDQLIDKLIYALDGPEQREAQTEWDTAIAKAYGRE